MNTYIIEQKYVKTAIYLFLILYAGLAAPKLPKYVSMLFDNFVFRLFIMFLIAYLSVKDVGAALLVAIGLTITLLTLNHHKVNDAIINLLNFKKEAFMPRNPERSYDMVYPQYPSRQVRFEEPFDGDEYASA
jgi:hypothetical protein